MIAANDSSLNSIAAALNFYDSHHFFHAFRTATGMSPSEYKKEVLQEIEQ
jgi:AraC-like DNA-binding protein